jgi:hypothetical protein
MGAGQLLAGDGATGALVDALARLGVAQRAASADG